MSGELVLVTGGSGFIGVHCIIQLLNAGCRIKTTIRSLNRETDVRKMITIGGATADDKLSFVAADLVSDEGWIEAVKGCDYVLHVASPFPSVSPKHEDELIIPAVDGTLRVLRAARDAGVKRVVLTSSFAAIGGGHPLTDKPFDESTWTELNESVHGYAKSKTLAERAAWDFMANEGGTMELSVINPVVVLGPILGPDYSYSVQLVQRLMDGAVPGIPNLSFGLVDVRDVADLHLKAMVDPAAKGERFIASGGDVMTAMEMALALKAGFGAAASKVPTRPIPDWVLRMAGLFDPSVKQVVPDLGKVRRMTNEKAKRVLGWKPRSNEETVVATAESMMRLGLLKNSGKSN